MNDAPVKSNSLRRYAPCGCVVLMFASIVLLPAVGWMIWSTRAARLVEEELAKIEAAGEPLDTDGLSAFYALSPEQQDATQLWLEVLNAFEQRDFANVNHLPVVGEGPQPPPPGEAWEQLEEVEEFLADYAEEMDKIHKATGLGGAARFDLDFELGVNLPLPHAQTLRTVSRMLVLEANVRAHRGDMAGVLDTLKAMLIAPRALDKEPIFVSQLVQNAMSGVALSELERMVNSVEFSAEQLQQLQRTVQQSDLQSGFRGAMFGERVVGIHTIRNPGQLDMQLPVRLPNSNEDLAFYLKYMGKWVEASREPFPEALDRVQQVTREFNEELQGAGFGRVRYQLTANLLPAMDAMFEATARGIAAKEATQTFIAVARFRQQHGRLPESLSELVPDLLSTVPRDPFDGQPIRYLITDDEAALIYSVGRNRVDDDGTIGNERLDEVFRLEPENMKPDNPVSAEPVQ